MGRRIYWIVLAVGVLPACQSGPDGTLRRGDALFTLLPSRRTGIDFVNVVEEGRETNILTFRNFYNGGGVAIGDINGDGLEDVFFTSNLKSNRLYLNKGDWKFEDITERAGVGGTGGWSTGATFTDVNHDGRLDLYVCNSSHTEGDNCANELYINKGDLTFTEAAEEWGLRSTAYSMHGSFFDYDLDGDLDCFLLNNNLSVPKPLEFYQKSRNDVNPDGGDRLFRNDGDHFTDVTLESGIYTSDVGFGLGVSVSDLNGDLWPDIYVSNDFWERDYLYINQGDGTFRDELDKRMGSTSLNSMGTDIADLNNDGAIDLVTTDMLPGDNYRNKYMTVFDPYFPAGSKYRTGYHYQLLQNSLQINDGRAKFQEVAFLSGVAASDWSWGALIFDFNNDGWKDLFISNAIFHDVTSLDFSEFLSDRKNIDRIIQRSGKFDWQDFSTMLASNPLANYAFVNGLGEADGAAGGEIPVFTNRAAELGLGDPGFSNGAAYGDLDNDGDLDLVINNFNDEAFVYRNNSTKHWLKIRLEGTGMNRSGIGARIRVRHDGMEQYLQYYPTRSFESSVGHGLVFGLGESERVEELEVIWPDHARQLLADLPADREIVLRQEDAMDHFQITEPEEEPAYREVQLLDGDTRHVENPFIDFQYEILLPRMLSTDGPVIIRGDVNGDGREDFLLGGAIDDPDKLFIQDRDGWHSASGSWQGLASEDSRFETTCGAIFDADGDGDQDILLGAGGNELMRGREAFVLRFYENAGAGDFFRNEDKLPPAIGDFSCIRPEDFDGDGDLDLFIGARVVPGNYGLIPRSYLLQNDGKGHWTDLTRKELGTAGMVTDALWSDVDGDGDRDLLVACDWMNVKVFKNVGGSINYNAYLSAQVPPGWWTTLVAADLDGDGDEDYVAGNWGLNSKFRASPDRPLTMFVKDFDNNGKSDFIINWYPPTDTCDYPFATKEDMIHQIPSLEMTNPTYDAYATKPYEVLVSEEQRQGAIAYRTTDMATSVIWNLGDSLVTEPLPLEAQVSPVFAIVAEDLDGDGYRDLWLGGNFYGLKPEVGYNNASRGVFLKGKPPEGNPLKGNTGSFISVPPAVSGIEVSGEVRDACVFEGPAGKRILVARNNGEAVMFEQKKP
jgi:hypothetical protein